MAVKKRLLMFFVIFVIFDDGKGLELSIERFSEQNFCGRLHCTHDVIKDRAIFSITGMTIYDVTDSETKLGLASVSLTRAGLFVEQDKSNDMNGTGNISRYQAQLTLDFGKEKDCLYRSFQCELDFVNLNGHMDLIRKTLTPEYLNNGYSCVSVMSQLTRITTSHDKLEKELTELGYNSTVIGGELSEQRDNITIIERELSVFGKEFKILQNQNIIMKEDLIIMRRINEGMKEELTVRVHNNTAKIEELAKLKRTNEDMKKELTVLVHNNTATVKELARLKRTNEDMKEELTILVHINTATVKELTGLKRTNEDVKDELTVMVHNNTATLKELAGLKRTNEEMKEELIILKNKTTDMKEELTLFTQKYSAMNEELSREKYKNAELEEKLTKILQQNSVLETQMNNFSQKFDSIERVLNSHATCRRGQTSIVGGRKLILLEMKMAMCDTVTDGGGWIIIQRRTKGDMDFYRGWSDYKNGFGTPDTDFWIGNDVIHNLTSSGYTELRVDLEYKGRKYFAHYSHFSVGDEVSKYKLSVSGYSGTAGDSLTWHGGMKFSTFDQDNDLASDRNCADSATGAWWYRSCHTSNLNGVWGKDDLAGVVWKDISNKKSVSSTEMKIRHV